MHFPSFDGRCNIYFLEFFYCNTLKRLDFIVVEYDYVSLCFVILTLCCMIFYVKGFKVRGFLLQSYDLFSFIVFGLGLELEIDQAFQPPTPLFPFNLAQKDK